MAVWMCQDAASSGGEPRDVESDGVGLEHLLREGTAEPSRSTCGIPTALAV